MNLFGGAFRSRDYPKPTKRHWKCKLGSHDWGPFSIERMSETVGWCGHAQYCQRPECDRRLFHIHPPENGDIERLGYSEEYKRAKEGRT